MSTRGRIGRWGALAVLGIAAAELVIMISPFAGFFYARLQFEPFLGLLSQSALTAWLDGFFLNHSVVTRSPLLEWHRKIGIVLFLGGLVGFFISAWQVYGNKLTRRGVATGLLYRYVRHPQYLCLAVAGYGLLTGWPRFLLLGIWVTMLFLYAGLARFEERRMEERFGEEYRAFAATRGSFLPGSPIRRLFELTFGRLRPRPLGWAAAYVFGLTLAFSVGFALRAYTRASAAILLQPTQHAVVISVWPQPDEWIADVFEAAVTDERVQGRLAEERGDAPLVATVLTPRYGMRGMFYKSRPEEPAATGAAPQVGPICGLNPENSDEPVEVVFSRAAKPYKDDLALEQALDPGVRLTPLVVIGIVAATGVVTGVHVPYPQNAWGPNVVMPIL